nr:unnamed protein product [Naegleria fowleri]
MFAQVQQTNTSNGSEISILNQELISNQTLSDGSFKILQTGSSQYMQPLLMRKKVSGFQVTFQMKLDDLFVTRNVNDTFTTNFTTTTTTTSDIMSTTTTNKPSLRTFLVSNTRELPNKIESKFRFQLLYSKYQLPFSFPIQVKTPYGINSLLFDGVFSLNDPAQDDSLNLQKRVPVANNAISTIIVIVNGIIALTILSLLIIFRNTEPRASRGYLPYVIFIHVFINFAKDFVQSFYGEEYLLIAFVFCTLSVLSFSYLMYFLNTLLFFYKRKVYNDVYQKMKRDSLLDRKKSSSDAYSSPSTLGNNNMLVSTENGTVTTVNHSLTHIVHHTPDLSIHHQNNNNNGIQPVEKQVLTPSNPTTGIELSLTTTTNTTTNITNITNTTTTTTNTINTFPMNHSVIQNNSLSSTSSPPNASNPAAVSKNSFDPVKTEHSMTISLTWVKSRKVRWISAICVAMVVLLSLSAIVPVLMLSSVANVLLTIYAVLGVLVTIGSVLVIGSLSFDMMWNWKRLFYKCEWKAYFFRNDPLYYRLELFIHILSALFYLALSISLLIQRDQIDNLSLLTSQTYRGVAPIATFVSLPIECLAVFFEMMAAGGGFICLMTAYEKIRLRNQEKSKMETLDLISVDDEHSQEEEFPSSAQLEKSSCSFPKMRTNIHSPLMELLGEDLSRLFIDDKGYELLRLYSKSEFSIENVAFINDIEKIYSQLFCDIETNSLKQRRGSGGSTPSFSRLIKPTLKQNLRREVLDSVYSTLCQDFFDLYVSDHAKLPVNFSFQSKVIFNNWLQQGSWSDEYVKSDDFTSDIDFIALDVVRNLRDTFRRFQLTQSYKDWKMQARKQHALLRSALKAKKVSTLAVVVDTATQTVEENRNSQTVVAEDATLSATMVELKERGAENNQDNDTSNHV